MSEKWYDPVSKRWYELDLFKALDAKIAAQIEENNKLREENNKLREENNKLREESCRLNDALEKARWEKITGPAGDALFMFIFVLLHAVTFAGAILFLHLAF